jgi:hypothetical protein
MKLNQLFKPKHLLSLEVLSFISIALDLEQKYWTFTVGVGVPSLLQVNGALLCYLPYFFSPNPIADNPV